MSPRKGDDSISTIREHTPDANQDSLSPKTSSVRAFRRQSRPSVFVGASRNKASPHILILLRTTQREADTVRAPGDGSATAAPLSADSQQISFKATNRGKPAIYRVHVERFVEKIEPDN
jgi:hypothetical protein